MNCSVSCRRVVIRTPLMMTLISGRSPFRRERQGGGTVRRPFACSRSSFTTFSGCCWSCHPGMYVHVDAPVTVDGLTGHEPGPLGGEKHHHTRGRPRGFPNARGRSGECNRRDLVGGDPGNSASQTTVGSGIGGLDELRADRFTRMPSDATFTRQAWVQPGPRSYWPSNAPEAARPFRRQEAVFTMDPPSPRRGNA